MPDLIASLANNIVPPAPEPAVMETNTAGAKDILNSDHSNSLTANSSRPLDPDDRKLVDAKKNDDIASGAGATEESGENFRKVFQKHLSDESEPQTPPEGEKKPQKTDETAETVDAPATKAKNAVMLHVVNPETQVHARKASDNAKPVVDLNELKQPQTDSETEPTQKSATPFDIVAKTRTDKTTITNNSGTGKLQTQLQTDTGTAKNTAMTTKQQVLENETADPLGHKLRGDIKLSAAKEVSPPTTSNLNSSQPSQGPEKIDGIELNTDQIKQDTTAPKPKKVPYNNLKPTAQKVPDGPDTQVLDAKIESNTIVDHADNAVKSAAELTAAAGKSQNIQPTAGPQSPTITNVASTTNASPTNNINATENMTLSPSEQIIQSIRLNLQAPEQEIYISLNPPELGRVLIRFRHIDGEITGLLQADKPQTKYDIEQSLPQVVASLQDCGVQVRRVDVILNDQTQQGQYKNDTPDDFAGMEKQQFAGRPKDENPNPSNPARADADSGDYLQPAKVANEIANDTINVYA
jgi:flagellar hook-length control protein FliK